MFKYFVVLLLLINSATGAFASGTTKLVDYMVSGSGLVEILGKYGVKSSDAELVRGYVGQAIGALGSKKVLTRQELQEAISKLPVTGADANVRKELQLLLDKSEKEIKKEDVVKAVNKIIYLANREGGVMTSCIGCINDSLAAHGFELGVASIKNAGTMKIISETLPKNPAELNSFITIRMRRLGMGNYAKVTPDLVSPTEERTLALFLALAEDGSVVQKNLIAAIKRVSTKSGQTNIIDPKNPHKFWKVLEEDMSDEDMIGWTKTLNEVADLEQSAKMNAKEAFYRELEKKAEGNDYLKGQLEKLKAKGCFFK